MARTALSPNRAANVAHISQPIRASLGGVRPMIDDLSKQGAFEAASEERPWTLAKDPNRRCTAHKKTGERCTKIAILGGTVCTHHGGKAKAVRAKAQQRIQEAADRMVSRVLGIADSADVPPAVALAAARDMLDRAGHRPPDKVDLEVGVKPYENLLGKVAGFSTMTRAESRARRGISDPPALDSGAGDHEPTEIVDAEVVEDHEPTQTSPGEPTGIRTDDGGGNPPGKGLMTLEEANRIANQANQRAGVYGRKRRR